MRNSALPALAVIAVLAMAVGTSLFSQDIPAASRPVTIVRNGSFDDNWTGWVATNQGTRDEEVIYDGSASLRIDSTSFVNGRGPVQYLKLKPGTRYVVSFAVKLEDVIPNKKDRYYAYGSCGAYLQFWGGHGCQRIPSRQVPDRHAALGTLRMHCHDGKREVRTQILHQAFHPPGDRHRLVRLHYRAGDALSRIRPIRASGIPGTLHLTRPLAATTHATLAMTPACLLERVCQQIGMASPESRSVSPG